jgi:hypothetical protein
MLPCCFFFTASTVMPFFQPCVFRQKKKEETLTTVRRNSPIYCKINAFITLKDRRRLRPLFLFSSSPVSYGWLRACFRLVKQREKKEGVAQPPFTLITVSTR